MNMRVGGKAEELADQTRERTKHAAVSHSACMPETERGRSGAELEQPCCDTVTLVIRLGQRRLRIMSAMWPTYGARTFFTQFCHMTKVKHSRCRLSAST